MASSDHTERADPRQLHRDLHHQAVAARAVIIPLAIQQPLCDDLEHLRCLAGDVNGGLCFCALALPGQDSAIFRLGRVLPRSRRHAADTQFHAHARPGLD